MLNKDDFISFKTHSRFPALHDYKPRKSEVPVSGEQDGSSKYAEKVSIYSVRGVKLPAV